jgi:hypothetical protein
MFEVGKVYRLTMIEGGGQVMSTWKVEHIEGTLLRLSSEFEKDRIINVGSLHFIGAELMERDPASEERWRQLLPPQAPS